MEISDFEASLRERFGDLLTLPDVAAVLRYRSVGALRKANKKGLLPVRLIEMPPRRGLYVTVHAMAQLLHRLETEQAKPPVQE